MKKNNLEHIKRLLKASIISSIGVIGKSLYRIALRNAFVVFVYHDVSDNPSEFSRIFNLNTLPAVFERQIEFIKNNFNIISPDDMLRGNIPINAALITFDDGMRSCFTRAIPFLLKQNIPSIVFLNMEPVKGGTFWAGLTTYLCKKNQNFQEYIKKIIPKKSDEKSLYLFCDKEIIEGFIKNADKSFKEEVSEFVGEFATENDLKSVSLNPLVFLGNHLFNHEIPSLLSDTEFIRSFICNQNELQKYPNYRNIFSFPFGQPRICYSQRHIEVLLKNGVKKLFSSSGGINYDLKSNCLDRIVLYSNHDSFVKMRGQILTNILLRRSNSL